MKYLIAFLAFVSTTSFAAFAATVDVSRLTQEQRDQVQLEISKMVATKNSNVVADVASNVSTVSTTLRNETSQWADLGKNVGTALVASAKEVGQGVNEFSQTPVGQITTGIIVYKVIGRDVIRLIIGVMTLVIGTAAAFYIHKNFGMQQRKYENIPRFGGAWISKRCTEVYRDSDWQTGAALLGLAVLMLTWVTGLNILI